MERFNALRHAVFFAIAIIIAIIALAIGGAYGFLLGLAALFVAEGLFIGTSIVVVPANPPTKAIPKLFGRLVDHLIPAGWYILPFRGDLFVDVVMITGEELSLRWDIEIRTPDNHYIVIPFFIYFRVDNENPIQFLIAGNKDVVTQKIKDQIEEILREWITSPSKGPQTWREARRATEVTLNAVLKSLFEDDLERINHIPSEIPTEILFLHFYPPRSFANDEDRDKYLDKMRMWEVQLAALSPDDEADVRTAIERRRNIIRRARNGNIEDFRAVISGMGVLVTRIGLSNIEPTGETSKGVDRVALATLDREKTQIDADATRIKGDQFRTEVGAMQNVLGDAKEARRAVSVRQGLTKEDVKEQQFSLGPDMLPALGDILRTLLSRNRGGNQ